METRRRFSEARVRIIGYSHFSTRGSSCPSLLSSLSSTSWISLRRQPQVLGSRTWPPEHVLEGGQRQEQEEESQDRPVSRQEVMADRSLQGEGI